MHGTIKTIKYYYNIKITYECYISTRNAFQDIRKVKITAQNKSMISVVLQKLHIHTLYVNFRDWSGLYLFKVLWKPSTAFQLGSVNIYPTLSKRHPLEKNASWIGAGGILKRWACLGLVEVYSSIASGTFCVGWGRVGKLALGSGARQAL